MQIIIAIMRLGAVVAILASPGVWAQVDATTPWQTITTSDGSTATARHEATAVSVDGKLYLMGGRGDRPVEVYDPAANSWRVIGSAPIELHHFQPVAVGQNIYAIAAFTCCYPNEPSIADIYVFDTTTEQWSTQGSMPSSRVRGAAAAVLWQEHIYVVGGNTSGHSGGAVAWLDRYNPETNTWEVLSDAPDARDHFAAVVVDGQLVAAGGRATSQPDSFANTIAATNVYDFSTGAWRVGADIPTQRAGAVAAGAGNELIIAGGEASGRSAAFATTEAYDVNLDQWRTLQPLAVARHSGGAAVVGTTWHVIAGNTTSGGGAETSHHETLDLGLPTDQDSDGLSDNDESTIHNTDPTNSDTDNDGAIDGDEVDAGSSPLNADTDNDTVSDGDELNTHNSNPLAADTDNDGLGDGTELALGTDLLVADSDGDSLIDGAEVAAGTDPLKADTDDDGITDQNDSEPLTPTMATNVSIDPGPDVVAVASSGGAFGLLMLLLMSVGILSRKPS